MKTSKNNTTLIIITGCAGSGKTTLGKTLAREKGWAFIDKDTLTSEFVNYILDEEGDRESLFYKNKIKPLEYKVALKTCKQNLELGNSVVLVMPFTSKIRSYGNWLDMSEKYGLDDVDTKFIWIEHNEALEYDRIKKRNASRDEYKLAHWEEYSKELKDISPDKDYKAFIFDERNNNLAEIIEWIEE